MYSVNCDYCDKKVSHSTTVYGSTWKQICDDCLFDATKCLFNVVKRRITQRDQISIRKGAQERLDEILNAERKIKYYKKIIRVVDAGVQSKSINLQF